MAIWDRPRQVRMELQENVYLDAFASSEKEADAGIEAYVGKDTLEKWKKAGNYAVSPYNGDKRGLEINYERQLRELGGALPELPAPLRIAAKSAEKDSESPQAKRSATEHPENPLVRVTGDTRGVRVEPQVDGRVININITLAELEPPGKKPSPQLQEEFRATMVAVEERVRGIEDKLVVRQPTRPQEAMGPSAAETVVARNRPELGAQPQPEPLRERSAATPAEGAGRTKEELTRADAVEQRAAEYREHAALLTAQIQREAPRVVQAWQALERERPEEAQRLVQDKVYGLTRALGREESDRPDLGRMLADRQLNPGTPYSLEHVALAKAVESKADQLSANAANLRQRAASEMGTPATEFRGTIVEAIREAQQRRGVVALASPDDENRHSRIETPDRLVGLIERVREQVEPEARNLKAYTVREDGSIHNVVTGRDEYVPVQPHELAAADARGRTVERNGPREGPAPGGGRPPGAREVPEPEVSVSMS